MTKDKLSKSANKKVLKFYKELPFNYYSNVEEQSKNILNGEKNFLIYGPLKDEFKNGKSIIDIGCGAGYLTNSISYVFPDKKVLGIDFNSVATERAKKVSDNLNLHSKFKSFDLFNYKADSKFDLAISIGVLMHTNDCLGGLEHIIKKIIKKNGKIYIGLYNKYGRKPFLDYFNKLKKNGCNNDILFQKYSELHSKLKDKTHLNSWFRDQIQHPHETQLSIKDIIEFLKELNFRIKCSSINKFKELKFSEEYGYDKHELNDLFSAEKNMEKIGLKALEEKRYYPGFFTFLAEPKRKN